METTSLSTLVARMQRWQAVYRNTEEQFLVYDLDEALRNLQRTHMLPWALRKSTLRLFADVLEYPEATDHLKLAFIEGQQDGFDEKPKPYYTSIQEFYEDPNNRSQVAEIWDGGEKYLGVRDKKTATENRIIDTCESDSGYTISGDITTKAIDNVFFKTGSGSLRLTITNSTNSAILEKTFSAFTDSLYRRKYPFWKVYLSSVPTSITLRFGTDSSNYFYKTITTQFSGQALKANDWINIAMDSNAPDGVVGTVDASTSFDYYALDFVGAASGDYYVDEVSFKEWGLVDYWYYSKYAVKAEASSTMNKQSFVDDSGQYDLADSLVGPKEYADVVMYDGMLTTIIDVENAKIYPVVKTARDKAWATLLENYPSLEPNIITHTWRFNSQMGNVVKSNDE